MPLNKQECLSPTANNNMKKKNWISDSKAFKANTDRIRLLSDLLDKWTRHKIDPETNLGDSHLKLRLGSVYNYYASRQLASTRRRLWKYNDAAVTFS